MMPQRKVPVFFYGSFINKRILREHGFDPERIRVAKLWGFDVRIDPLTRLVRSDQHCVYGILCDATHAEMAKLYSAQWMETYLPEAVIVELQGGQLQPAFTYIPDEASSAATQPPGYVDGIVDTARELGFPGWYVQRLEGFRP